MPHHFRPTASLFVLLPASLGLLSACSESGPVVDANGDGVADTLGWLVDADGDGVPDQIDLNNDGIPEGLGIDTNGDGIADGVGIDTNGDGIIDGVDTTGDGVVDIVAPPPSGTTTGTTTGAVTGTTTGAVTGTTTGVATGTTTGTTTGTSTGVITPPGELNGVYPSTLTLDEAKGIYDSWKATWVKECPDKSLRVDWDEAGKTVSEGIGYGMLLAVAWDDKTTFDGLHAYFNSHLNSNGLMGWKGSCSGNDDNGNATDADLDVAMSLLQAECKWPDSGYATAAVLVINAIKDDNMKMDGSRAFLCAGDGWGDDCCGNASYQTPAYYRSFGVAANDAAYWNGAATDSYYYLDKYSNASTGLVSDWMPPDSLQCNAKGAGDWHGWDASRVPWRVVTDFAWWGTAEAGTYAGKIAAWVTSKGGLASTCQGHNLDGTGCGGTPVTTFAGAFASAAIAADQASVDANFTALKGIDSAGYFNSILYSLYTTLAVKKFAPPECL